MRAGKDKNEILNYLTIITFIFSKTKILTNFLCYFYFSPILSVEWYEEKENGKKKRWDLPISKTKEPIFMMAIFYGNILPLSTLHRCSKYMQTSTLIWLMAKFFD